MATLRLQITTDLSANTLAEKYERSVSSKYATVQDMAQLLEKVNSGGEGGGPPTVTSNVKENATRAHGTLTLASVVATNTATINGVVFTAIASGATGNLFNVGADDTATAVNLAAAINGSVTALIAGYVTATSAVNVVTVSSTDYGIYGNQTTFVGGTNITASPSGRLASGAVDPSAKVYTF